MPKLTKSDIHPEICPGCDREFIAAWGWIIAQSGAVIALDGDCARRLRYGPADKRRDLINEILARAEGVEIRRAA
jgi:hypothetical protein